MRTLRTTDALCSALSVAVVGVLIAACGGGDDTAFTGGGNATGFGEELAIAACDKLFECCNAADLVERVGNSEIVDYAGCHILYSSVWRAGLEPIIRDSEAAERLAFDAAKFQTCINAINAQSCGDFAASVGLDQCADAFVARVDAGGACSNNLECMTGLCEIPSGSVEGSCVQAPAPAGLNEACSADDDCESGLYCAASACAMKKADGGSCTGNTECQSRVCVGDDAQNPGQCGTVCEGGGPGRGAFDRALADISVPFVAAQCSKPLECCTTAELEQLFLGLSTKAECYSLHGALYGLALVNLHNYAAEGKASVDTAKIRSCIDAYEAQSCQEYSRSAAFDCPDGIKGLVAEGSACAEDLVCASGNCEEPMPDQGTCAPMPAAGGACTDNCVEGFYCNAGTCAAQKSVGDACGSENECLDSRCVGPVANRTCSVICDGM